MNTGPGSSVSARHETQTDLTEEAGPSANGVVQVAAVQSPGLALQLATAGVAACIADMITFPLDTTKVGGVVVMDQLMKHVNKRGTGDKQAAS